jgi:hypothetical protein
LLLDKHFNWEIKMPNKIYVDSVTGLEICDCSGVKSIEQIGKEFNVSNLVDVTQERLDKAVQDAIDVQAQNDLDAQIKVQKDAAIDALISGDTVALQAAKDEMTSLNSQKVSLKQGGVA